MCQCNYKLKLVSNPTDILMISLTKWESCQWLGGSRWFLPGTMVSSTSFNWLVTTSPQYGKKIYLYRYIISSISAYLLWALVEWMSPNMCCIVVYSPLTLWVSLEGIVCYFHTLKNNLWIKQKFTKYLKESCCLASNQHFSFQCFQENAFLSKIFPKSSGLFWPLWVSMG